MRSIKLLPVVLIVVMVLTLGLMTSTPVAAVKGSYPGRNGKIAFDATDPISGYSQVYVMNADGTGVQDLTNYNLGDNYSPVWSPDGTRIAFTRDIPCDTGECRRIFVMNADGTGQVQLTVETAEPQPSIYHYRPAWSPDGTKIAFHKYTGGVNDGIYVIGADVPGAGVLLIAGGDQPSWSPDGSKIVFSKWDSVLSQFVIWVMNADGSSVTSLNVLGDYPNWSPDGTKIIFATGGGSVSIMNADGSEVHVLTPTMSGIGGPDWQRLPAAPSSVAPVGGFVEPVNKVAVVVPWLTIVGSVAAISVVIVTSWKKPES
ncbi:MAG: hypothetical protein ABSG74_11740 [Candidatus Bathyarchaeia archaeon]|jgi:Tol biopolymer transport system component